MSFEPTQQQRDVLVFFEKALMDRLQTTSIFLNAVAGSGKTSTIMLLIESLKKIERDTGCKFMACSVSFNTSIRDAMATKLKNVGSSVQAKTTNQLGRSILVAASKSRLCRAPQDRADTNKYRIIVEKRLKKDQYDTHLFPKPRDYGKCVNAICTLVDAVRATQINPNEDNLIDLIIHYDLDEKIDIKSSWWSVVVREVWPVIQDGIKEYQMTGVHDFNDQISLPLYLNVASSLYDVIFVDEAQDLNRARLEMIRRSIKPGGVLFWVGDPKQAIQGFTFADVNSVDTIINATGAIEFPLSVCWRCDSDIIRLAKVLVPHIEARPGAELGTVETLDDLLLIERLQPRDLVLCRVNAPLARRCIECIQAGKPAVVRGRDIGKSVIALLEDIPIGDDFEDLDSAIQSYIYEKVDRLFGKEDAARKIAEWNDKGATLQAFLDGYKASLKSRYDGNLDGFKYYIQSKFSDSDVENAIVFSTIHKAKGLECAHVFVIEPKLLPHPAAKLGWQTEQEMNIIYVAVTRAKRALFFVGGVPACLNDEYREMKGLNEVISVVDVEEIGDDVSREEIDEEVGRIIESVQVSYTQNTEILALPEPEIIIADPIETCEELSDEYIESVLAPVIPKKKVGRHKKGLKRINITLDPCHIELTKDIDRSELIRQLLNAHFGLDE